MNAKRTIGRLAKEAGVGVETVRFYERQGLIDQPPRACGPRHYDDRTLATLKYIRAAQGYGLSLRAIKSLRKSLTEGRPFCQSLQSLVERKLIDIARQQAEMAALSSELEQFLGRCKARPENLPCPVVQDLHTGTRAVAQTRHSPGFD